MTRATLVVAIVAFAVYANTLGHDFTYDDVPVVRDDDSLATAGWLETLQRPYWPTGIDDHARPVVSYRPVTTLSFALNRRAFGEGAFSFHLVNVLLHALVCGLVHRLAARWLGEGNRATVAALLFAVHPVHVEAVAGIVGRAELLAATFYLGALLVFSRRGAGPGEAAALLLLSLAGALSKEHAVTLPVAILLVAAFRGELRARPTWVATAATTTGVAISLAMRSAVLGSALDVGPAKTYWDGGDALVRISTALVAFAKYLALFVFPRTLSADYSFDQIPLASGLSDVRALAGLVLLLGMAAFLFREIRSGRRSATALGLALFLLTLVPVANVLFPVNVILAERLLYLPSLGLCVAAVALLAGAARRLPVRASAVLTALVLLALAGRTVARNPAWKDDDALFTRTVADAPRSARAWAKLGEIRAEQGRADEAREHLQRALEIHPGEYGALDRLGHLALEAADPIPAEARDEALRWFEAAGRADPTNPAPPYNRGIAELRAGRPDRAREAFEESLALSPSFAPAAQGLASAWQLRAVREAGAGRLDVAQATLETGIVRVREVGGDPSSMETMLAEVRRMRAAGS